MDKGQALKVCRKCPDNGRKSHCIIGDIESIKGDEVNPPECLVIQSKAVLEGGVEVPEKQNSGDLIGRQAVDKTVESAEKQGVQKTLGANPNGRKSSPKTVEKSTKTPKNGRILESIIVGEPAILTSAEKKFLKLVKSGIISPNRLAVAGRCSIKNVYKYLRRLRKKGIIDKDNLLVDLRGGTCLPQAQVDTGSIGKVIRVHGQQFKIRILNKKNPERYKEKIGTEKPVRGNRICMWEEVIEIYAQKNLGFTAEDRDIELAVSKATEKSLDYWAEVIGIIQNDLGVVLVKERTENIKIVKQHIAHEGNEFAKDIVMRGEKFHIFTTDGKLRMIVDASLKVPELEAVNVGTESQDMERAGKQIKDWIDNDPATGSEFERAIKSLIEGMSEEIKSLVAAQGKEQMRLLVASQLTPDVKTMIANQLIEKELGGIKSIEPKHHKNKPDEPPYHG